MTNDIVTFLLPDGSEVSNDPRFDTAQALQKALDSTEETGDAGIPDDEQSAQTLVERPATLNSGQPGVGENSVPDDIVRDTYGPLGSPAQQVQKEDAAKAAEEGGSPDSTTVDDDEPVDSNEAVLQVRKDLVERREKTAKALEEAGQNPGDSTVPYADWTAKQLKAEVAKRNADGRADEDLLDVAGMTKKSQYAEVLEADDANSEKLNAQSEANGQSEEPDSEEE